MDDLPRQRTESVTALRDAIRKARIDDAERSSAIADLRAAEMVRLEILHDALAPLFAELPDEAELFDHGLVPGERPRLFVDILAFVEMGRDKRQYRFVQDTRWGQRVMIETDDIQSVIRAVTDYVALRIVERRKALASDGIDGRRLERPPPVGSARPGGALDRPAAIPAERVDATPPASSRAAPLPTPAAPRGTPLSPTLVFALGVVAGILATLFIGLMRARGILSI